jgi:phage protein U
MFAQLGSIQFNTVKTFGEFSEKASANYAEHALLTEKPRLQRTGSSLNEITISIFFHNSFCIPKDEFDALKDARNNGEILPLLWGDGTLEGDFVITDLEGTREETSPEGVVLGLSVHVTLKEYVVKDRLQQEQTDNRSKAKAVGNKKPVAQKKNNASTCAQAISALVNRIFNHYAAINDIIQTGEAATPISRSKILSHLSASRLLDEDLLKRCDDPQSCASTVPDVKYNAQQHLISINRFNQDAANSNTAGYDLDNKYLGGTARRLREAAQKLINQSITRK